MAKDVVYYKLTDQNGETFGGTKWGEGVTHKATGKGHAFCSPGLIHFYNDPLLAVLLNPIHACFANPRLWEISVQGKVYSDDGLKFGAKSVTTEKEVCLQTVTTGQRVHFAILCALRVCDHPEFVVWARAWLSGTDRSYEAAARADAWTAAEAAARADAWAATRAAGAAARTDAWAAEATARNAARAATRAARAAGAAAIDFVRLAKEAVDVEVKNA